MQSWLPDCFKKQQLGPEPAGLTRIVQALNRAQGHTESTGMIACSQAKLRHTWVAGSADAAFVISASVRESRVVCCAS